MSELRARRAPPLDERSAARLARLFRAFSDTSRIRLIGALLGGEQSVRSLAETVGISQSDASHHLRGLRQMSLVRGRKEGRMVFYQLDDSHVGALYRQGLDHVLHG